jgi:hypothetical protein
LVVDDVLHVRNVEAARGDVRGDEEAARVGREPFLRPML